MLKAKSDCISTNLPQYLQQHSEMKFWKTEKWVKTTTAGKSHPGKRSRPKAGPRLGLGDWFRVRIRVQGPWLGFMGQRGVS